MGCNGWHPKHGETPEEGINTEVKEELGIDITNQKIVEFDRGCDVKDCYIMYYTKIDFLVSSDIVACRNSLHYGNEFICNASIGVDKIASVDIRLLRNIKTILSNKLSVNNLIDMYNNLIKVAMILHKSKLNIPLREMSDGRDISIDVDKLCKSKYLVLK